MENTNLANKNFWEDGYKNTNILSAEDLNYPIVKKNL